MIDEPLIATNTQQVAAELAHPPALAEEHMPPPSEEQARMADHVFSHQRESDLVIGLLGLQTGALILHDVAVDTFTTEESEEEKEPRPRLPEPVPEG
jgi:hypothetical protein